MLILLEIALKEQGKLDKAIEQAYDKAISIKPDYAEAYNNLGVALKRTRQASQEAITQAYDKAISIKPDYAESYNNMGNALKEQGKLEEAIEAYKKQSLSSLIMLRPITTWVMLSKIKES